MGILSWIVFGLIAGAIAKAIHPGPDLGGIVVTCLVGIVGAVIGGFLGRSLLGITVTGFNFESFLVAVGGALRFLILYRIGVSRMGRSRRTTV